MASGDYSAIGTPLLITIECCPRRPGCGLASACGPMLKAFGRLDAVQPESLASDLLALPARFNIDRSGALAAPGGYLEVIITT